MEYTVVIRKEHCIDANYFSVDNCPFAKAIKEQLPLLKNWLVGGDFVSIKHELWRFDNEYKIGWNSLTMSKILSGEIEEHSVTFISPNHIEELSNANVLEASKLVNEVLVNQ